MISFRPLLASAWMGIQHQLAWTLPGLSLALYAVAPFASAITVSMIYWFGTTNTAAGLFTPDRLAFVLIGSTLYAHVASYAWVPTIAIAEGKNLSVFPHIYLTGRSTAVYVAGRAMSAFVVSTITSVTALIMAYFVIGSFLGVQIPVVVTPLTAAMVAVALFANIPAALGLGYILGAYSLYASKFEWSLPGYVAGLLMVFSGALFPTSILPWPLSVAASYLPYTQFIAAARGALLPGSSGGYAWSLTLCMVGGLILLVVSLFVYFAAEKKARKDGVIDRRLA
jgi:hypothetical protein